MTGRGSGWCHIAAAGTLLFGPESFASDVQTSSNPIPGGRYEQLACLNSQDQGLTLIYIREGEAISYAPRVVPSSFAECPRVPLVILTAQRAKRDPTRPAGKAADIREASPLRSMAAPFDFGQTIDSVRSGTDDPNFDDELAERERIQEGARWLYISMDSENIDKLEELFSTLRDRKERTKSGVWKLTKAYGFLRTLQTDWTRVKQPGERDWDKEKLNAWKLKYPNSPTPYIFEAATRNYHAVAILRDRLALASYPGGVEALKSELQFAREILEKNKAIASKDPYYFALLVMIMRNQRLSAEEVLQVAFEGADTYPDFFDTYFEATAAIGVLSKKPLADIEALANTAIEKSKSQIGDEAYARIYWNALQTIVDSSDWYRLNWNWQRMKSSMRTIATRYPVQWNIQNFARFSCIMQDVEETQLYVGKTSGPPLAEVWSQSEFFDACREFAQADVTATETETRKAKAP